MPNEEEEVKTKDAKDAKTVPDSVWDEYVGQLVCVQLKNAYLAVTSPGIFARTDEGFIQLPMLRGIFGLKKDLRGGVRAVMTVADPDGSKQTRVRIDLDPDNIDNISVAELPNQVQIAS